MDHDEKRRLKIIEDQLSKKKHHLEALMPVHIQVDRQRKSLENQINALEDERTKLLQGQLTLRFDNLKF